MKCEYKNLAAAHTVCVGVLAEISHAEILVHPHFKSHYIYSHATVH